MAESSWPLPPNAVVSDTQYEQLLLGYTPSGVVGSPGDTGIITAPGSGTRIITVRLGKLAFVRGHLWSSGTSDVNLASLAANASGNPRIDLVVLRYTRSTGVVAVAVITGTPAASPSAPAPTQTLTTSGVFEIPIAQVAVANGATTITTGNITSRETYLSRTPLLGSAAPTTATPGVYLGQEFHEHSSAAATLKRWWWTGTAWRLFAHAHGAVARGRRTTSSSTTTSTVGIAVLRLDDFAVYSGRQYRIAAQGVPASSVANDGVGFQIHYTTDGSTPTAASPILPSAVGQGFVGSTTIVQTLSLEGTYTPGADQTLSLLLCVCRTAGSGNVYIFGDATFVTEMTLTDLGVDPTDTGTDL